MKKNIKYDRKKMKEMNKKRIELLNQLSVDKIRWGGL